LVENKISEKSTVAIQKMLMEHLSQMPVGIDELSRTCHLSVSEMQMALLEMELAGRLSRLPGNRIVLIDE